MSFLDELNGMIDLVDPAKPLFEDLTEDELAEQHANVKRIGQKILMEEAQSGQRSPERDALMIKAINPYEFLISRGHSVTDISTMDPELVDRMAQAVHEAETGVTGDVPMAPANVPDLPQWPEAGTEPNGPTIGEVPIEEQLQILQDAVKSGETRPDASAISLDGGQRDIMFPGSEKKLTFLESLIKQAGTVNESAKQLASGAIGTTLAAPNALMGVIASAPKLFGMESPLADSFMNDAGRNKQAVTQLLGANPNPEGAPYVAHKIGENVIPAGKLTGLATALNTGGNIAIEDFIGTAEAGRPKMTPEEKAARKAARDVVKNEALQNQADIIVETFGGPAKIPAAEYWSLAPIAFATAGAFFAPKIYAAFKTGNVPKPRQIDDIPDLVAISRNRDLARNADDVNAGLLNIANRAGMPPHVVDEIEKKLRIQTRSAAKEFGNAAVQHGEALAPTVSFKTKIALADLAVWDQPNVRAYLKLRHDKDTLLLRNTAWDDEQKIIANKLLKKPNDPDLLAQVGVGKPEINGKDLQQMFREIHDIEKLDPNMKKISKAWNDIVKEQRRFMSDGEYGVMSSSERKKLNSERPDEVPYGNAEPTASPFELKKMDLVRGIQRRLENEVRGTYVDEVLKLQAQNPGWLGNKQLIREVTPAQLKDNPHWEKRLVTVYRRGEKSMYITDKYVADMLGMDVYNSTSVTVRALGAAKDIFQASTTGKLAPFFATTGMMRNYFQAKFTTPEGFKSPTALGTLAEVPRELYPKMAGWIAERMSVGSQGWVNQTLPPGVIKGMSLKLAKAYDDDWLHMANAEKNSQGYVMDRVGSGRGSWLQGMKDAENKINATLVPNSPDHNIISAMLAGYSNTMNAMHSAAGNNFFRRNRGRVSDQELAMETRRLTGDSTSGGIHQVPNEHGGGGRRVQMEGTNAAGRIAAQIWSGVNQAGRDTLPWHNVIQQSIKRTGEAYLENPAKFIGRGWLYSIMPASAEYFYAASLGTDPYGIKYTDYHMLHTPDGKRMMNWYIPIPGRPAAEGIWLPTFQEMSVMRHLTHNAWHHMAGNSFFTEGEDFRRAAETFAGVGFGVPVPPAVNMSLASQGLNPIFGFMDDAYRARQKPHDPDAGLPKSIEIMARAVFPSIADIVGSFAAGMMSTPATDGAPRTAFNGFKDAGKMLIGKNPVVRDIFNLAPASPGKTPLSDNHNYSEKTVNGLVEFMRQYELGDLVRKNSERSKAGGYVAKGFRDNPMPLESAGYRNMKPPDNPLYNEFMGQVYARLRRDDPRKGGIGFQSLMERYRTTSAHIRDITGVNSGNAVTWQEQLNSKGREKIKEWLVNKGIDTTDRRAVHNYLRSQQQLDLMTIINVTRHVENEISQKAGRKIKLKDLKPYL